MKFSDKKLLEDYKELNKILKKKIKQRIKDFENELALKSKTNPKQVYAYMNKVIKVKDTIRAIQSKDGSIETNGKKIADTLNDFFASVFTKSDGFESPTIIKTSSCSCQDLEFNEIIVEIYLNKLDTNKAIGFDKVHSKILRECSKVLAEPLSIIFNKSFQSGSLPKMWSCANIVPLFKKRIKLMLYLFRLI